jgi:hypothetical protein
MGKYQKPPYYGTLKEVGREEELRLAGEDRSPKKWVEAGTNYGSWQLIDRSGKNSKTTYVPKGTTDSIIIITIIIIHSLGYPHKKRTTYLHCCEDLSENGGCISTHP